MIYLPYKEIVMAKVKALIVVDIQNYFMKYDNFKSLADKIDEYISKSNYEKIIFTKFINKKKSLFETKMNWTNMQDKKGQDISIPIPPNAMICEKYGFGLEQKTVDMLKNMKVKEVDIYGLKTDACVFAISLQLFDNGIYPNILINYTATVPEREKYIKDTLIMNFGKIDERK